MKKALLAATALIGASALSNPARAEMALNLGGYFSGYGVFADNNLTDTRELDLRRDTEVHVSGETTLDNGLTVGFHTEQALGGATITNEAYAYFSGTWGRVNLGSEDGAAYLLQVAAPSADSNIDGLRTYIQAISSPSYLLYNPEKSDNFVRSAGLAFSGGLDYAVSSGSGFDQSIENRLTYLTPKVGGFQAGVSYTPSFSDDLTALSAPETNNYIETYENAWEAALRWDGNFRGVLVSAAGGYAHSDLETEYTGVGGPVIGQNAAASGVEVVDGLSQVFLGSTVQWQGWSLGGSWRQDWSRNKNGIDVGSTTNVIDRVDTLDVKRDTWVAGLGWDQGPWHLGASWLQQDFSRDASGVSGVDDGAIQAVDATIVRYTLGAGYQLAQGIDLRGSLAWGFFDNNTPAPVTAAGVQNKSGQVNQNFTGSAATNNDFTQITVGTQIAF